MWDALVAGVIAAILLLLLNQKLLAPVFIRTQTVFIPKNRVWY